MVKYITILGYFILICCIGVAGIVIFVSFSENDLKGLIFLVPIYMVGHYTLLTLKGRNNIDLADNRVLNLIAYLNIGFFAFFCPLFSFIFLHKLNNVTAVDTIEANSAPFVITVPKDFLNEIASFLLLFNSSIINCLSCILELLIAVINS